MSSGSVRVERLLQVLAECVSFQSVVATQLLVNDYLNGRGLGFPALEGLFLDMRAGPQSCHLVTLWSSEGTVPWQT